MRLLDTTCNRRALPDCFRSELLTGSFAAGRLPRCLFSSRHSSLVKKSIFVTCTYSFGKFPGRCVSSLSDCSRAKFFEHTPYKMPLSCIRLPSCHTRDSHDGSHSSNKVKHKEVEDRFARTTSAGNDSLNRTSSIGNASTTEKIVPGSPESSCCIDTDIDTPIQRMNSKVNVHSPHSPKSRYLIDVKDSDLD